MAIPADTQWEVQSTASDNNGGGFSNANKGATGTDMTYPTSSPTTFTSSLSAVGTTALTDSGAGFVNTMLGNVINIAGQGLYCITGFTSSSIVTVDRNLGTFSTTTGVVGGAHVSPGQAASVHVAGNTINIQAGTYSISSNTSNVAGGRIALTAGASQAALTFLQGYEITRGDNGTKPLLQVTYSGGGTITVVTLATNTLVNNLSIDCNSKTTSTAIDSAGNCWILRCYVANSTSTGINCTGYAWLCEIYNASGSWAFQTAGVIVDCEFHDSAVGSRISTSAAIFINVVGYRITAADIFTGNAGSQTFINCTAYGATGTTKSGFVLSGTLVIAVNCVAYNVTKYGFDGNTSHLGPTLFNCAAGKCSTATTSNLPNAINFVTITDASTTGPFTNVTTTVNGVADFSLNSTAGAGALLRAAGYPGIFPSGKTVGYADIGAVQHQDSGGGGTTYIFPVFD